MSSESGRPLSMEQLKAQIRANAAMASETQTTVILTDKNWGGLTSSVTLLSELEARNSETLRRLITVQQMKDLLEEQVQNLQTDLNATEANVNAALSDLQNTIRYSEIGIPNVKPAKDIYAWPQPTVTKMLKDRVYTGAIVGNKRPTVSFQLKKRVRSKEEDLVIVEGMHEPIIDIDTFEKVQKILKTRHKDSPKEAGGLLNGYLKCSDCGKTMTRSTWKNHKPNEHYSCRTYRNYGKAFCTHHYIQAQVAEELILRDIREKARAALADDGEIFREMCQRSKGALNADREKLTKQIAQCRTRLIEIDTVVGKMYEDKILGKIPEHRFEMMTEKYDKESAELQAKIDEAEQALKAGTEQEVNTEIFRGIISKYVNISELTLEVLADTIEKIVVGEREKVDGKWRQRFDIYYRFVGLI